VIACKPAATTALSGGDQTALKGPAEWFTGQVANTGQLQQR
jgi:hypothetical protein